MNAKELIEQYMAIEPKVVGSGEEDEVQVIRRLAKEPAKVVQVYRDSEEVCVRCKFCGEVFIIDKDGGDDPEDECLHDDDCPWRLAKEYVENLSNPGYFSK